MTDNGNKKKKRKNTSVGRMIKDRWKARGGKRRVSREVIGGRGE